MFQPNNNSTFGLNTNNTTFGQPNQFGQQPTFGSAANTSFGATNTGSVFGQPIQNQQTNSVFGAPPTNNTSSLFPSTANTSFGSTANAFGQTTANTFGNQGAAGTSNAFGSTTFNNASAFGASPTTGNSVFGQNQSQTPSLFGSQATNTGLCGSSLFQTPTTSFGINPQTNNPGNTSFGAQASTPTAFGSNTGIFQNNKPAGALFGTSNTFGSSTFGTNNNTLGISTQQQTTGTTIRFNPPTGNDYIQKAGAQQNVPTRHQNITAMKEYESKSVDELRLEDYGANRKGSQNTTTNSLFGGQSSFGNITGTPFGQPQNNNTSVFGQTQQQTTQPTTNIFGSLNSTTNPLGNANTSLFSSNNAFGTLNSTNTSTANTFGQPNTFNQANAGTTNTFANTSFGSNLFGQSSTAGSGGSVFGQTQQPTTNTLATTGLFGAQQPSSTLGSSNLFQTTTTPFGITPPTSTSNTTFGVPTTTASTFGTSTGNMFQAKPNNLFSGNSTLGNTTFNSFSSNNNTIRFNQPQDQQKTGLGLSSSLGSTTQTFGGLAEVKPANDLKLFGATNSVGQTFDAFNSSNSLFGGGQQSNTSLFNFNPTNTTFGQTNSPLNGLQQQQQHQQQQQNQLNNQSRSPLSSDLLMNRLRTLPYGDSSITHDEMSPIKVTTEPKLFKMSSKSNSIVTKPPNTDRVRPNSVLFDGLEDPTDMKCALDVFVPKKNIKKLGLKSKPSSPETDVESPEESPSISALHKIVPNIDDSDNINDESIPISAYQSSCEQEGLIS